MTDYVIESLPYLRIIADSSNLSKVLYKTLVKECNLNVLKTLFEIVFNCALGVLDNIVTNKKDVKFLEVHQKYLERISVKLFTEGGRKWWNPKEIRGKLLTKKAYSIIPRLVKLSLDHYYLR